ncbi:hypothetical protein O9H85_16795 [Paenibacillus filicis]|uniref:Uncharacterized protein n=1 Tax=Paenibacillus gyeongsangnamensis TaxID=3388067 RepID=A0ABT4QB24_9BACL|nr:hypothetical protein [Paenibacillus filicis]MCZ8514051.1 hypothetical protein [Paenibacillus filicis]
MGHSTVINNIFILKINSIENASAINVGQNFLAEWSNSDKRIQGYGQNYGDDSDFVGNSHYVDDKDLVDFPALKRSAFLLPGEEPR